MNCKTCCVDKPANSFELVKNGRGGGYSRRRECYRCRKGKAPAEKTKRFFRPLDSKRYLVTSAQNNTRVHEPFLAALKTAAAWFEAELVVIPYRYKNPTGMHPGRDLRDPNMCRARVDGKRCFLVNDHEGAHKTDELWWDPKVEPYLYNERKKLNDNLVLCADVKVQATASQPLSSFESLTGAESCIIGAPKMQYKTVSVPAGKYPKILSTTGTCTERNYSNTKAGAIGEFHHYLGALIVEIVSGKEFHLRQLNANRKDGSFTDLNLHFTSEGVSEAPPAESLRMGDIHVSITDPDVDAATFGPDGIVELLKPKVTIADDVFDGETVNPHEDGDIFLAAARSKEGRTSVFNELQAVVEFVNARAGADRPMVIVDSNHHDFLRRWVVKGINRGFHDAKNLKVFGESVVFMAESARMTPGGATYGNPFIYWMGKLGLSAHVRCLETDESFVVAGIENGMHGHNGPNGARGTVKNLSRLGRKVNTGHGHAPEICEGHYRAGTSTPRRQAYHRGPGSNLNTHIVTYATGARALLTIIGRAFHLV